MKSKLKPQMGQAPLELQETLSCRDGETFLGEEPNVSQVGRFFPRPNISKCCYQIPYHGATYRPTVT